MNAKQRRKEKRAKIGVAKGYGPRHSENAKEGDLTQPSTDTVPAMLTPREAVLNRNAAEMAGRGEIEKLNAAGNKLAERGVDLAGGKSMKTKKLASGSPYVAGYQGLTAGPAKLKQPPVYNATTLPGRLKQPGQGPMPQPGIGIGPTGGGGSAAAGRYLGPPATVGGGMGGRIGPDPSMGGGGWPGANVPRTGAPMPAYGGGGWPGANVPRSGGPTPAAYDMPGLGGGWGRPQGEQSTPLRPAAAGRGGSFYPGALGMQGGTSGVSDLSAPGISQNWGAPPQLQSGDLGNLVAALTKAGQQQGLSPTQIQGLLGAVQGMGGGGDTLGYGGGTSPLEASGGFQGGISDIGYPPFVAPGAEYHADKGSSWVGPYDEEYMIPRYAGGTSSVWTGGSGFFR